MTIPLSLRDDLASRNQARSRNAAEMGAVELITELPPERVVALIRQVMNTRADMEEQHFQAIAAAAGKAETDLVRKDWPVREGL